jgi:hypothetical protein
VHDGQSISPHVETRPDSEREKVKKESIHA